MQEGAVSSSTKNIAQGLKNIKKQLNSERVLLRQQNVVQKIRKYRNLTGINTSPFLVRSLIPITLSFQLPTAEAHLAYHKCKIL